MVIVKVKCPNCGWEGEARAGTTIRCPKCGAVITVPQVKEKLKPTEIREVTPKPAVPVPPEYTKTEREKVTAGMGTTFKPKKGYYEKLKGPPLWALGRFKRIFERKKEEKPKEEEKSKTQKTGEPEKKKSYFEEMAKKLEEKKSEMLPAEYLKQKEALEKLKAEEEKKLKEAESKTIKGKISGIFKRGAGAEKEKIVTAVKERLSATKSYTGSAVKLYLLVIIDALVTLYFFLPALENWVNVSFADYLASVPVIGRFLVSWFTMGFVMKAVLYFIILFTIIAIPAIFILGKLHSFAVFNSFLAIVLVFEIAFIGFNNYGIPLAYTYFPQETAMMKCLIKYHGDIAICAVGENPVKPEKEDNNYETLSLELGQKTGEKTWISKPVAGQSYYLVFRLINTNKVGSNYVIKIPKDGITVNVSNSSSGKCEGSNLCNKGPTRKWDKFLEVKPGWPELFQVYFDELPACTDYYYFNIQVKSSQVGGGRSFFRVADKQKGNENFIYFFDPQIKTQPGPLDIYVYTTPFALVRENLEDGKFIISIKIENKKDGIADITGLKLIQKPPEGGSSLINVSNCTVCIKGSQPYDFSDEWVNNHEVNLTKLNLSSITPKGTTNSTLEIRCEGKLNPSFTGKATQLISVNANYTYTQTFNEQTGGIC